MHVISWAISLVCSLNYPYSCFSCKLFLLILLLLDVVINIFSPFLYFSSPRIVTSSYSSILAIPLLFFFLTHRHFLYHPSSVSSCGSSSIFLSLDPFVWVSSLVHFKKTPEHLTSGGCPNIYSFDGISFTRFSFEKFSCFSNFFFHLHFLDGVHSKYSQ